MCATGHRILSIAAWKAAVETNSDVSVPDSVAAYSIISFHGRLTLCTMRWKRHSSASPYVSRLGVEQSLMQIRTECLLYGHWPDSSKVDVGAVLVKRPIGSRGPDGADLNANTALLNAVVIPNRRADPSGLRA